MFDKLKQLKELKQLKDSLEKETVDVEKEGIKLTMNGNFEVQSIDMGENVDAEALKDCFNEAVKSIQFKMAEKFKGLL